MRLRELAGTDDDSEVTGFAIDHRKVARGSLFGAFRGSLFNGEDFIGDAVERGAIGVVARAEAAVPRVPHIADDNPRRRFAELASSYFAPYPKTVVAVTGTNGKTSTVEMTRQIWRMAGQRSASIGTLGVTTSDDQVKTGLTTPDIVTFLSNMAGLRRLGISHVAYEASSHGLDQHRCEGVPLNAVAFTNFSRDHLDYHPSMEAYFEAKMRLFDELLPGDGTAVVWTDDPKSRGSRRARPPPRDRGDDRRALGRDDPAGRAGADHARRNLAVRHGEGTYRLALPLIGAYQASNVLVAAGLAMASWKQLRGGVRGAAAPVAGARAARAGGDQPRRNAGLCRLCPYRRRARSGDRRASAARRQPPDHRVRRGGDRDQGKRPGMGAVAARLSDVVIVTDDNPRGEEPAKIRSEVLAGAPGAIEIGGRREAIAEAVRMAGSGDIILLAGKGHETGQIIGAGASERVLPFDDALIGAGVHARRLSSGGCAGQDLRRPPPRAGDPLWTSGKSRWPRGQRKRRSR